MEEMEHIREMFIDESLDLLQEMESALNQLKAAPENAEMLNLVFRAAHTIKGSAGLFGDDGYDAIVSFTHTVENVLAQVRSGERACDDDLILTLLDCRDHIESLIEQLNIDDASSSQELAQQGQELLVQLAGSAVLQPSSDDNTSMALEQGAEGNAALAPDQIGQIAVNAYWHFSLRFGEDVLRNGMDPLPFLRYLSSLGDIVELVPLLSLPGSSLMDPESCYLGLELQLDSDADQATLMSVFEFVADECQIHIIPPHSNLHEYVLLMNGLDQEASELGPVLVRCGALTQDELAYVLDPPQPLNQLVLPVSEPKLLESELSASDIPDNEPDLSPQMIAPKSTPTNLPEPKRQESRSLRVDAHKLDQLINLVGELVIAGANTSLLAKQNSDPELVESSAAVSLLVEEIRGLSLHLRMIPIDETFKRFHRVVREISRDLDKDIRLKIEGGETELDKGVVEKISDPLMHLVRNAIDHGIEAKEDRIAKGKAAAGTITLRAYYDSGSIVIEVCDDGGGIDPVKVQTKAIENGLISADQVLSEKEILRLILEAGLTTKATVSDLSGRGVGMDVVKRNIEALQGSIEVESEVAEGSLLRLRLPLTLSIIDGFAVGVGASSYVIPLDAVIECIEYNEQHSKNGNYVNLRGEILPFINLRQQFNESHIDVKQRNIVVVQSGEQKAGFVVDQLQGELQTVIKPLSKIFSHLSGISGSTILGSGEVAMILDVPALIREAETRRSPRYIGHEEVVP